MVGNALRGRKGWSRVFPYFPVTAVAPGFVLTGMTGRYFVRPDGTVDDEMQEAVIAPMKKYIPLRSIGEPEDIAAAVLYQASDASRLMTGHVLRPTAGWPWCEAGGAEPTPATSREATDTPSEPEIHSPSWPNCRRSSPSTPTSSSPPTSGQAGCRPSTRTPRRTSSARTCPTSPSSAAS